MTAGPFVPVLPEGLRARIMTASLAARAAGASTPAVTPDAPQVAFDHAAGAFYRTLTGLHDADWDTPVLRDLDVQGLVGHLIGVETDVQRAIGGDPAVANAEHVSATQAAALAQAGRPPLDTVADWQLAVGRTMELADRTDLDRTVGLYGMRLSAGDLLVVRTFELWTHENDIRSATGLPPSVPRPATLRPMTELAAALLPRGTDVTGLAGPVSLHLVLTGPGGGTWDIGVGGSSGHPAPLTIVAGVVGFCRLVSNRIAPDDLDALVTGERRLASAVLAAAAALALD